MNRRQDDLDAAVAAADPYPQPQVDDLAVDEAGRDLMETIMTDTQPPRRARLNDQSVSEGPRRTRMVVPLLAAAAVTAIVAGGFALQGLDGESATPDATPAAGPAAGPTTGPEGAPAAGTETLHKKSLPPTGANLHNVLGAETWRVDSLDDSEWGGSLLWTIGEGEQTVEMHWAPAEDYQGALADRQEIGPVQEIDLLGQTGKKFTYPGETLQPPGGDSLSPTPARGDANPSTQTDTEAGEEAAGARVMVLLPPVDGWYLEFDVMAADEAAVEAALAELHRVSPDEWQVGLGQSTVQPAEGEEFLDEVAQGVPMPDGVEVTTDDLNLPQSAYFARVAFLQPVLCGWAEDYVGGDKSAIDVLRASKDWPVVKALAPEGDYPSALADAVRKLAKDRDLDHFGQGVGC
ncbi:hypothetical protein ASG90_09890 [Nocardioides sp. Soil797]|nr:hypothetical protein ASG90_09890 [Nocardioides sp. Soil797]